MVTPRNLRLHVLALLVALAGCGGIPHEHRYPSLDDHQWFLCCTTRFNEDRVANDGGYRHPKGVTMPAGTALQVVGDEEHVVVLQPAGDPAHYYLKFRFGHRVMSAEDYFRLMLLDHDPRSPETSPAIASAIAEGRLVEGMTRAEAIAARGYPPRHRTPDLAADRWVYYDTPDDVAEVRFQNDRLVGITAGKAVDLPAPEAK